MEILQRKYELLCEAARRTKGKMRLIWLDKATELKEKLDVLTWIAAFGETYCMKEEGVL